MLSGGEQAEPRELEQRVIERTEEVVRQKSEIESKNEELEILYKQVTDSIHYAKRIQRSLMPTEKYIQSRLEALRKKG